MAVSYTHLDVYKRQVQDSTHRGTAGAGSAGVSGQTRRARKLPLVSSSVGRGQELSLIHILRNLFKDEVRQAGRELGLPEYLVSRQPFPGPGLGIRIIGEVTPEKVAIVQDADAIWREEIAKAGLDKEISQYYAALTNMHSVGVMGDERTYDYAVALRAVTTTDFMTAESYDMPWSVLGTVTSRIVNEVKHVNRVFYDCTGKPPATIELE